MMKLLGNAGMSKIGRWESDDITALEQEYQHYFEKLDDSTWQKLSYDERREVLQKVEEYEAKKTNRPSASFQTKDGMPIVSRGYYSPSSNSITQNYQYTMANSSEASLKNVLHEGRHAYQWDCVKKPQNHPEIDPKQIEEWKTNFDNYISASSAEDKMQYYMQPVEKDARGYADAEIEQYSKYQSRSKMNSETGRWERDFGNGNSKSSNENNASRHSKGNSHNKR